MMMMMKTERAESDTSLFGIAAGVDVDPGSRSVDGDRDTHTVEHTGLARTDITLCSSLSVCLSCVSSGQDELVLHGFQHGAGGALRQRAEDPVRLPILFGHLPPGVLHRRDGHVHDLLGEGRVGLGEGAFEGSKDGVAFCPVVCPDTDTCRYSSTISGRERDEEREERASKVGGRGRGGGGGGVVMVVVVVLDCSG